MSTSIYADKSAFLATGLEPNNLAPPSTPPTTSDPLTSTDRTCPICLSPLTPPPLSSRIRTCTHAYHLACLSAWLDRQNTCPACRAVLFAAPEREVWQPPRNMAPRAHASSERNVAPRRQTGRPGSRHWATAVRRPWGGQWDAVEVSAEMPSQAPHELGARREYGVSPWDEEEEGGGRGLYSGASEGAERDGRRFMPGRMGLRGLRMGVRGVDGEQRAERGRGGRARVVGGGFGIQG